MYVPCNIKITIIDKVEKEVPLILVNKFEFDLSNNYLYFINDINGLVFFEIILKSSCLIGIDTETKPQYIAGMGNNDTSIIQIAVVSINKNVLRDDGNERVFIIDLNYLLKIKDSKLKLIEIFQFMLNNENIIKIGQGLDVDFRDLFNSYPDLLVTEVILCYIMPLFY